MFLAHGKTALEDGIEYSIPVGVFWLNLRCLRLNAGHPYWSDVGKDDNSFLPTLEFPFVRQS